MVQDLKNHIVNQSKKLKIIIYDTREIQQAGFKKFWKPCR